MKMMVMRMLKQVLNKREVRLPVEESQQATTKTITLSQVNQKRQVSARALHLKLLPTQTTKVTLKVSLMLMEKAWQT